MARSITCGIALIGVTGIAAALTAQVTPTDPGAAGPDIVVNGAMPTMVAGLWRFRSGTRLTDPIAGQRQVAPQRGQEWDRCIADGDTPAIVDQLIGAQAGISTGQDSGTLCSALRLSIDRTHVSGSRRCTTTVSKEGWDGPGFQITTGLRGTIAETRLRADYVMERGTPAGSSRVTRWQVTAERIGICAGAPRTAVPTARPVPVPDAAPSSTSPPVPMPTPTTSAASAPTIVRETRAAPSDMAATTASAPSLPAADASPQPEDIVVIARRLRRLRLHYGVDGDTVNWCHADISSGDKRVDRIGCAIVRACTKSGADTVEATLACFRRRVDSLEADAPPA